VADAVNPLGEWPPPALAALVQVGKDMARALPRMPKLPPTQFKCAICNTHVGLFIPRQDRHNFQVPTDFTCPKHGRLREPGIERWLAAWERQGRPEWTKLKLPPV
jgi:hypothetical protein